MKINSIKHIKKQQSITIKIQTPMKKQILLVALIILVIITNSLSSFGQGALPSSLPPRTGTCVDYPLHPKAGVPYTYEVNSTAGNTVANWTWWATKDPNFIDLATGTGAPNLATRLNVAPGQLISAGTGTPSDYGVAGAAGNTMSITWSPEILAATEYLAAANVNGTAEAPSPTFVVAIANGECTNNIQVYEINPSPSFTVDITNVNPVNNTPVAYDEAVNQCVDIVRGSQYVTGGTINMDYGADTLYFEVIAANFVTSWTPTFQIMGGLSGDQTASIGWAYTMANAENGTFIQAETTGLVLNGVVTGTTAIVPDASVTNTANGVSIFVRVIIDNNTYQSLGAQDFTLAVDGVDASGAWDLINADCTETTEADENDLAIHTINPRPTIGDVTNDDETNVPNTFDTKVN